MALDIVAQDIIVDESTGFQDDDVNSAVAPHDNATVAYLLGLDSAGGLSSPQVAYQANFVQATASAGETINSIVLAQDSSGTAFSTSDGVNSGIQTVDGNYVWLFRDATNANVVIGVIGTSDPDPSAMPAPTGQLAFSFALVSTSVTTADLYAVQYVPLLHPDPNEPDERIDLTDHVWASVSGTTTVSFTGQNADPGNPAFYLINSPSDATKQLLVTGFVGTANGSANVSMQGFGVANQSINPGETLQVDFVTGGTLSSGTAAQIAYGSHLETVTQAGFTINQITPSQPSKRVDITIKAYNVQGNEQGLQYWDGSDTNPVNIISVRLTGASGNGSVITANGTYGGVTISGLGTSAVTITGLDNITTVDITTSSPMDRLTVTGVDANEGCDITEFHFTSQTPNAYTEQVGSFINFDDSEPALDITAAPTVGAAAVTEASGAGGASQVTITPPSYTASAVDGYSTNVTYALALLGGTATGLMTTDGNHPITLVPISGNEIQGQYDSDGDGMFESVAFKVTLSGTTVTLTSLVALEHSNSPQGAGEDNTLDLNGLIKVTATVTVTDGDEDVVSSQSSSTGLSLTFNDTDPTLDITAAPTVGAATVTEASGVTGQSSATITPPSYTASAVDGYSTNVTYALALVGGTATGLMTTIGNHAIELVPISANAIQGHYDSDGDGMFESVAFTVTLSGTTVTLTSLVALEHDNTQGLGEDNTLDLDGLIKVTATVTVTDGDADVVSSQSSSTGLSLTFNDTDPAIEITAAPVVGSAVVNEASGAGGQGQVSVTEPLYTVTAPDGYTASVSYTLALLFGTSTNLVTTNGNHPITLVSSGNPVTSIAGMYDSDGDSTPDTTAFTITLSGSTVTLVSLVALEHANAQGQGEVNTLDLGGLVEVTATVTVTDGDGDVVTSQTTSTGALSLTLNDTDPALTVPFDADPGTPGNQAPEQLGNAVGQNATGAFGYDMTDQLSPAEYLAGFSDFVDINAALAGVQISLTGTVDNTQNPLITNAVATLTSESATSASFAFSFHYDADPITPGVQDGTAGGTLVFDKVNDTYTITLTDAIDGFSFDVLHTSELVAKQPIGNTGHPLIVAQQLTPNGDPDPFFVQFTGNSVTQQISFGFNSTGDGAASAGDTTFTGASHDLITNTNEDWVSATQNTNGVAGDTIQKGELLTLRFFEENILGDVNPGGPGGGTERLDPTALASGIVIKFDGVGNSEDLIVILDLKDANGNEITRAINVQNSDLIRGNANVPAPYSLEFTLDNNDALLIIEQNDYTAAGETYQIQGIQIMQSSNGLTGTAINLDGAIGPGHGSSVTSGLTAWDPTDNDVLKIVDIGFVQQTSGTIDADLDFAFNIRDGDGDLLGMQHINLQISNMFIV